jgi:hypothetical protein
VSGRRAASRGSDRRTWRTRSWTRFDVYVPPSIGPLTALAGVLPRAVREALMRAIGADRLLWVDGAQRRGYELRAARSEPALDPVAPPRALTESGR